MKNHSERTDLKYNPAKWVCDALWVIDSQEREIFEFENHRSSRYPSQMETFMGRTLEECVSEMLFHPSQARRFLKFSDDIRLGLLLEFLIGPESERFNAVPTYGKTGVGYLKSKGTEGLRNEIELEKRLRSGSERAEALRFLAAVEASARQMIEEYEPA